MTNQNNTHAAQMNSNQLKRQLLFWLIGLLFFNLLLLLVIILLIMFAPALLHRCAHWKSKTKLKQRQRLMEKHHLVVQPPLSALEQQQQQQQSSSIVSTVLQPHVSSIVPSYDELSGQLNTQNQLIIQLTRDLQGESALRKSNTFFPRSNIS
jgi:hypothetical protein